MGGKSKKNKKNAEPIVPDLADSIKEKQSQTILFNREFVDWSIAHLRTVIKKLDKLRSVLNVSLQSKEDKFMRLIQRDIRTLQSGLEQANSQ